MSYFRIPFDSRAGVQANPRVIVSAIHKGDFALCKLRAGATPDPSWQSISQQDFEAELPPSPPEVDTHEVLREEGREEIRTIIREAAKTDELIGPADRLLNDEKADIAR